MIFLRASWVVPVTAPPIADGLVGVAEGHVQWVGAAGARERPLGEVRDLGHGALIPGLVNAHCHLELASLRGLWREVEGFIPWVEELIGRRGQVGPEEAARSTCEALEEAQRFGTTLVGDIANDPFHGDLLARSRMGGVVFVEAVGWDPTTARETLATCRHRRGVLATTLASSDWRVGLAAHAPHSVSSVALRSLAEKGELGSIHVAEAPVETEFVRRGGGDWARFLERRALGHVPWKGVGTSVVRYLEDLDALQPGMLAVHCVHVSAEDAAALQRHDVRPVLCPRSNLNLGGALPPLQLLLEAGLRPAVGTDSLASVADLNVLSELALLRSTCPDVPAQTLLEMATVNGAAALGFDGWGAIAAGKKAALAFAPMDASVQDPLDVLVSGDVEAQRVVTEGTK